MKKDVKDKQILKLVQMFQCPGCVCGGDVTCGQYEYSPKELRCVSHVLGTSIWPIGIVLALGLPKGFNRPGFYGTKRSYTMDIRLYPKGAKSEWDKLNVPVWAMEKDGFLFVRTYAPRINMTWVDVIEGGSLELVPGAIDVGKFIDEID